MSPVQLYLDWTSPPCRAVAMSCHAAHLPLRYVTVDLRKSEHRADDFLKINPDHCVPTIVDEGFVLWESRAIVRYLYAKYAPDCALYPQDLQRRALVDRMLDFDLSVVTPTIRRYVLPRLRENKTTEPDEMESMMKLFNDTIFKDNQFAAGDSLSVADIFLFTSLTLNDLVGYRIEGSRFPRLIEWMKRVKAAPFYSPLNALYKQAKQDLTHAGQDNII